MLAAWRRSGRASSAPIASFEPMTRSASARLEDVDGAPVKLGVAEVDFFADDELAARHEDPLLHGLAVVRLAEAHDLHLPLVRVGVLLGEILGDLDGSVLRTVLGEDDLVAPTERLQPLAEIHDGGVQDGLLVVDRDDERDARVSAGHDGACL